MSNEPIDKRRARQKEQPWYRSPITWKVVVLVLRIVAKIIDLFH